MLLGASASLRAAPAGAHRHRETARCPRRTRARAPARRCAARRRAQGSHSPKRPCGAFAHARSRRTQLSLLEDGDARGGPASPPQDGDESSKARAPRSAEYHAAASQAEPHDCALRFGGSRARLAVRPPRRWSASAPCCASWTRPGSFWCVGSAVQLPLQPPARFAHSRAPSRAAHDRLAASRASAAPSLQQPRRLCRPNPLRGWSGG
jgi:hypothetical protein